MEFYWLLACQNMRIRISVTYGLITVSVKL